MESVNNGRSCSESDGNLGFNSFNFMTFILLSYNLIANVNNNLNNNNNNNNDNNINSITQDSNQVSANTNVNNQIGIVILPIPGKRRKKRSEQFLNKLLLKVFYSVHLDNENCKGLKICLAVQDIGNKLGFNSYNHVLKLPMDKVDCQTYFPSCMI